jgi:hypothetical protein
MEVGMTGNHGMETQRGGEAEKKKKKQTKSFTGMQCMRQSQKLTVKVQTANRNELLPQAGPWFCGKVDFGFPLGP